MRRFMVMLEDFTLWVVETFGLANKLERLVAWAGGKLMVAEAEKATIKAFIQDAIDEDLPEVERGHWTDGMIFNEDFDSDPDQSPWGEDTREFYLKDPDNRRDSDEDR